MLLGPDIHVQHCTGISLDEARILAETGTHVASTPSAGQLTSPCPVPELIEMGCNVVTTTDGSAPRSGFDLIEKSQLMQLVHRGRLHNHYLFPVGKLLEMITIDAAKAIGWDDELGSLEPGKKADIITVDLNQPHLAPAGMSLRKWVLLGSGRDVDHVMVNGVFRLRANKLLSVDQDEVLRSADIEAQATLRRAGLEYTSQPSDGFWGSLYSHLDEPRGGDVDW